MDKAGNLASIQANSADEAQSKIIGLADPHSGVQLIANPSSTNSYAAPTVNTQPPSQPVVTTIPGTSSNTVFSNNTYTPAATYGPSSTYIPSNSYVASNTYVANPLPGNTQPSYQSNSSSTSYQSTQVVNAYPTAQINPFFPASGTLTDNGIDVAKIISGVATTNPVEAKLFTPDQTQLLKTVGKVSGAVDLVTDAAKNALEENGGWSNTVNGIVNAQSNLLWLVNDSTYDDKLNFLTDANAKVTAVTLNAIPNAVSTFTEIPYLSNAITPVGSALKLGTGNSFEISGTMVQHAANSYVQTVDSGLNYYSNAINGVGNYLGTGIYNTEEVFKSVKLWPWP